jgi:hypothetical protein
MYFPWGHDGEADVGWRLQWAAIALGSLLRARMSAPAGSVHLAKRSAQREPVDVGHSPTQLRQKSLPPWRLSAVSSSSYRVPESGRVFARRIDLAAIRCGPVLTRLYPQHRTM